MLHARVLPVVHEQVFISSKPSSMGCLGQVRRSRSVVERVHSSRMATPSEKHVPTPQTQKSGISCRRKSFVREIFQVLLFIAITSMPKAQKYHVRPQLANAACAGKAGCRVHLNQVIGSFVYASSKGST